MPIDQVVVLAGPRRWQVQQLLENAAAARVTNAELIDMLEEDGFDAQPVVEVLIGGPGQLSGWWTRVKKAAGKSTKIAFEAMGMGTIGASVVKVSDSLTQAMENVIGQEAKSAVDRAARRMIDALPLDVRLKGGLYASWPLYALGGAAIGGLWLMRRKAR